MWPMKLDMTREECRGVLRRLELESYGTVVSTFRAQGCLSKEKLRILEDLRRILHITNDRHRAEARRVANDERLTTVAEIISGPNSGQDWRREGHRTFPVLPRTVPHTALTYIANTVYEQLTRANTKLPHPADTSCDRLKKAEEMLKFELVKKELSLYESGFVRDAAVVTSDPLQDIMSKSYVNREEKCSVSSKPAENATAETDVTTKANGEKASEPCQPDPEHSSLCEILLNTSNRSENSESKSLDKCNKSVDRSPRKKPQTTKRTWKSKPAYPPAKQPKQGLPKNVKQSTRVNNMHSPHLIHSYAVPFDVQSTATNGSANSEPLQLQQHLTSNNVPQLSGQQSYQSAAMGSLVKSQQYATPAHFAPPSGTPPSTLYSHQQGILPSSKKDIQYNLSKLNPTSSLAIKGNVNIPLKGIGFYSHGKSMPHHLFNYQKKSPSKNILIPTSTAAATLASLGFPTPLHPPLTDHTNSWLGRDKTIKNVKTISNANCSPTLVESSMERTSTTNTAGIKQSGKPIEAVTESMEQTAEQSFHIKPVTVSNPPVVQSTATNTTSLSTQEHTSSLTATKSGNKVIVQSMQLIPGSGAAQSTPLTPTTQKNNVYILPNSSAVAVLNLGQKITLPKSVVDSSSTVSAVTSPPKVIVQTMPNPYSTASMTTPTIGVNIEPKNVFQSSRFMSGDEKSNNIISDSTIKRRRDSPVDVQQQRQLSIPQNPVNAALKMQSPTPSMNIPYDGVSGRKIKVSTSQLVPFTGKLNASSLPKSTGCITIGAKKIKINTDDDSSVGAAGSSSVRVGKSVSDWENESNRSNLTEHSTGKDSLVRNDALTASNLTNDAKTDKPVSSLQGDQIGTENVTGVQKIKESIESRNDDRTSSGGNTLPNTFGSHLSSTEVGMDTVTSHSEYDIVSTEREDDSSVTDSADAEDDLDDEPSQVEEGESIEEDIFEEEHTVDVEMGSDAIIIEEEPANYDYLIEEVPEDEQFVEEADDNELVEFISVGYETTGELVAELESGTSSQQVLEKHRSANGMVQQEELPPEIDYDQNTGGFGSVENGDMQTFAVPDGIVCDLLEMGSDGKYHARPYSYKQVLAEGMDSAPKASKQTHPIVRLI
uniref:ENT domain-containing protein n=1 Tax=Anopheles christyi TaxID=43041 RepID=A0A182K4X6_9DIPT